MTTETIAIGNDEHLELVGDIVSAYVSNNSVPPSELVNLIMTVNTALRGLGGDTGAAAKPKESENKTPAISIKKSVTPDAIICLEDGKAFKSLKRHLRAKYDMTPEQYRARWSLPADYPMVAPNYAAARSKLAKDIGLGRRADAA